MAVKDTNRVPDFLETLEELNSMYVVVGIISSTGNEVHKGSTGKRTMKIIDIANVHEFGMDIEVTEKMRGYFRHVFGINLKRTTTVIKIPERSFIRSAFDNKEDELYKTGVDLLEDVRTGSLSVKGFYDLLGNTCVDTIKNYLISEVNSPPNSALTIEQKESSNPLVDKGQLVESIAYEIRYR